MIRYVRGAYAFETQKVGFNVTFRGFAVHNIVGTCDVKFPVRLEGMSVSHIETCSVSDALVELIHLSWELFLMKCVCRFS